MALLKMRMVKFGRLRPIKSSQYGKWLKFYIKDPDQQQQGVPQQQVAPSFIPKEHIAQETVSQDPEDDIPF